jgi:hypothetical protein
MDILALAFVAVIGITFLLLVWDLALSNRGAARGLVARRQRT